MEDVIIIGSGPAGHTAGIYTARANLHPLMFEGMMAGGIAAGGQLTTTNEVENFPGFPNGISGQELMSAMRSQSQNCGLRIQTSTIDKISLNSHACEVFSGSQKFETKSIIIATGATAKKLGIKGEDQLWQRGISACAVCDGALPIFKNKDLFVIGGGDSAVEEAIHLTKFANKVILVVRRDVLRASQIMQKRIFDNKKIEILWNTHVIEAIGENRLTSVKIENNKNNSKSELQVSGLFYAIGHTPNTNFLNGQLKLDEAGYIETIAGSTKTSIDGVFACGDVQDKTYKQAITAAGSGCMAALECEKYLQN